MNQLKDKNGTVLNVGDKVHNVWGYDLIIQQDEYGDYYGQLVCEPTHSCHDIPYAIVQSEITKI